MLEQLKEEVYQAIPIFIIHELLEHFERYYNSKTVN
ncbi:hypothetical protein PAECIP111802_07299 [Paenibacillus allorhizosphaerae]|uniref:Uncharacterized protein n=1 Tax=Paenibacillus allorhizosphaerae TaxID=2849866 RepID=A0ABM8VUR5_9BACL|nr:hypothetical protein PAECIP111802_07299 [Paenibacillus allorhizosphaerae]